MLKLLDVTLCCLTGKNFDDHLLAMEKSSQEIEFGARKIIYDMDCNSIEKWNEKIIKELPNYVQTSHALLIHHDGYIINPHLWKDEWLELDYIGSPFPLPTDHYSYRDEDKDLVRVGNSVSLRSKKLMERVAQFEWKSYHGNTNEDGFICVHHRKQLEKEGFRFGTFEQALDFGREHDLPEHQGRDTFLFHQVDK